jgi:hypothetical protein
MIIKCHFRLAAPAVRLRRRPPLARGDGGRPSTQRWPAAAAAARHGAAMPAWTGGAGWGTLMPQGFPHVGASGRPVRKSGGRPGGAAEPGDVGPGLAARAYPRLAFATIFAAIFSQFCRDLAATHTRANAVITARPCKALRIASTKATSCGGGCWPCKKTRPQA